MTVPSGYRYRSSDGLLASNDPGAISTWESIGQEMRRAEEAWVTELRAIGVKAAHPDDGWVDRPADSVQFVYPQFNGSPQVGDLIALGRPDRYRLVRVVRIEDRHLLLHTRHYFFESPDRRS